MAALLQRDVQLSDGVASAAPPARAEGTRPAGTYATAPRGPQPAAVLAPCAAGVLPLLFLSGVFIPLGDDAASWITWISRIFPVRHFAAGLQAAFLGTPFSWTDVLVVAAWGVTGLLLAVRFFG